MGKNQAADLIMSSTARHGVLLSIITAVLCLAYANSFQGVFVFDDFSNIVDNRFLANPDVSPQNLITAATRDGTSRRWLPNLSFALNYALNGRDVGGYHLVNLLIHIGTALSLYFLGLAVLRAPALEGRYPRAREIAFLTALLWAVHPVQTNAVTYIVQRMTAMCGLFYLSSLLLYVRARQARPGGGPAFFLYGGSLVLGCLAMLSKENAATLPLMIVACEFFILRREDAAADRNTVLLWSTAAVVIIAVIGTAYLGRDLLSSITAGYASRDFTMAERLLTQPRVIFLYLSLLALPLPARLNLNHDPAVSHALLSPPETLFAILGLTVLAALIPYLYRRHRLLSFGLLWFLVTLIIESSVIPLELVYEHRLYLPSTMLLLAAVSLCCQAARTPAAIRLTRTVMVLAVCLAAAGTWERNKVWNSREALWRDVVAKSPGLPRGYVNLGAALMDVSHAAAEKNLRQAIALDPDHSYGLSLLGLLRIRQNRPDEAVAVLHRALAAKKGQRTAMTCNYLSIAYRIKGDLAAASRYARLALKAEPGYPDALVSLGVIHEKRGEYDKAEASFRAARAGGADSVDLYNNWGITAHSMGQTDRAIELFRKALERSPDHIEAHYNLGVALGSKGMVREAQAEMRKAMQLRMQLQAGGGPASE